jgi:hypothetical protein
MFIPLIVLSVAAVMIAVETARPGRRRGVGPVDDAPSFVVG